MGDDVTAGDGGEPEDQDLDTLDLDILDRLADLHARADGPPDGFDDRMVFALAAAGLGAELARLEVQEAAAARGDEQRTWTMSFEAPTLAILLTLSAVTDETLRIDGWLAPGAPHRVVLRSDDGADRTAPADGAGRFVFERVRRGLVQVVVHRAVGEPSVVTPSFEL